MKTLRISLGELIAAIPLVLGTEPHESIVALSVNADGLPTCALTVARATLLDPDSAGATAAAIAEEFAHGRTQLAVLVSYSDGDIREGCAALDALRLEVEFAVPRVEVLGVSHGHWFRPGCWDPDCCPPGGREMAMVPESLPEVIATARRTAEALATVSPKALAAAVSRCESRALAAEAWGRALAAGAVEDAAEARHLAAVLDDLCVRDFVVLSILGAGDEAANDVLEGIDSSTVSLALDAALEGTVSPDRIASARARMVVERVAKAARGRHRRAATQTLGAILDWWEGNLEGASQRCHVALQNDDGYRLAALVGAAAARGIAPGWMRKVGQTAQ